MIRNKKNSFLPAYSEKQMVSGDLRIFSSKRSFLFKKRIIEVSVNHLLLQIESNSFKLSCIRFCEKITIVYSYIELQLSQNKGIIKILATTIYTTQSEQNQLKRMFGKE